MSDKQNVNVEEPKQTEVTAAAPAPQAGDNTVILRIPKPNTQVIVLGLVAAITLFQTVQLGRLGAKAGSTQSVKATSAPAVSAPAAPSQQGVGGTGGSADVPQSMVGGC